MLAGTIEIINDVHILKPGDKVGASEATLLNMLNISPFSYGLVVKQVSSILLDTKLNIYVTMVLIQMFNAKVLSTVCIELCTLII